MKILFVCQQYIHAARWINQLKNSGHQIFIFDCLDRPIHKDLKWTNYVTNWSKRKTKYLKGEYFLEKKLPKVYEAIEPFFKVTASEKLYEIINEIKPDLVHSLEMQSQTYHLLKVRKKIDFKWAYFSWGSDIFLYQNKPRHLKKIKKVFKHLDYFFADNTRDIELAKKMCFTKNNTYVFPGGGGYFLKNYDSYKKPISDRNIILIKGYHHWAGRALEVLKALELIIDDVKEYHIYVYSAHKIVVEKIYELKNTHKLLIAYSTRDNELKHEEILEKFGSAKIAIGNSISDGIPNTLLEAIICGAFPIQSNPGGASEDYIKDGENGFLINDPEDSREIAKLINTALKNNKFIDKAYKKNEILAQQLEYKKIQGSVLNVYKNIENNL